MKYFAAIAVCAAVLGASMGASAQDARPYANGPVWDVSAIQTKDGHFDE